MTKKISALFLGLALLFATSCSAVKTEDMADLVGNVFGVQSMAFMMLLYGMPVENAVLSMNEEQTLATVTYTDYMIAEALSAMGAAPEDLEELPFEGMSGTVQVDDQGLMQFDLTLTGASVETLAFNFNNNTQFVSELIADGEAYDVNEALEKMAEERMKEEEAAAAEATAVGPVEAPAE
ncbi:MAG: hypothetical protein PQJ59_08560 [Spirochaetales bacterium]|nr:hypothetical protein [Spirochaetales bacterium]